MTEKQFENQVKKFLKNNNIYYVKNWGGGYTKCGIPDLFICLNGKFLAIELKIETRKTNSLTII